MTRSTGFPTSCGTEGLRKRDRLVFLLMLHQLPPDAGRRELRARVRLGSTRTRLVNHVRGVVKSFGGRTTGVNADTFREAAGKFGELARQMSLPIHRRSRVFCVRFEPNVIDEGLG